MAASPSIAALMCAASVGARRGSDASVFMTPINNVRMASSSSLVFCNVVDMDAVALASEFSVARSSSFMGGPFVKLVGVETSSVVKWAARHFPTHRRHLMRRAAHSSGFLPDAVRGLCGQVRAFWRVVAVGGIFFVGLVGHGAKNFAPLAT